MHPLVLLAAAAAKTPATAKVSWSEAVLFILPQLVVGIGLAELRRWRRGVYPWRLHSVLWGVFMVVTGGLALLLLILAWFTTKPRGGDSLGRGKGRQPGVRTPSPLAVKIADRLRGQPAMAPAGDGPTGVVPGTYGTSLPPHDASNDPRPLEPAGWLPDPTGRHEYRYWNGSSWSRHVADGGRRSTDAM
jgi:hypothetical protein